MNLVELDSQNSSVRFARPGVMLDLGAIGKGYAIDQAAEMLRDSGVSSALLHGGTSTIYGLGVPPDGDFWKIALEYPKLAGAGTERKLAAAVPLRDESLSVSAVWGRSFEAGGKSFGHVLDPRNGQPVAGAMLAAVALPAALETDALSTALLVAGEAGHGQIASLRPKMRTLVISQESGAAGNYRLFGQGILKER
jgi:thiamine biosynthesis lipoprotein